MNIDSCFKIGYVAKTHGLKGELTISLFPECPDLEAVETIFVQRGDSLVPFFLTSASVRGDKAFVKFEELNNIDEAADMKGCSLFLPKNERPKLARGEFYNDELIGFEVVESDTSLGTITNVVEAGPNRFLEMDHHGKEVLIPVNGPFIKSVNKSKKKVTVELPEGFLEL